MGVSRRMYEIAKQVIAGTSKELPPGIAILIKSAYEFQVSSPQKGATESATSHNPPGGDPTKPANPRPRPPGGGK